MQGTAGTTEEQIRYTWNYAMLIARGPSHDALIKSPIFRAMESGSLARFEEITRCASEVQDALISLLSEKRLSVPELATEIPAQRGFSIIATANTRDRGVNDMSAALKRRFNIVVLPTPGESGNRNPIVPKRVSELAANLQLKSRNPDRRGDRKGRHHLPRTARRPDARRQEQAQDAVRRALHGRSHLGARQQHGAGRQLRRRQVSDNDLAAGLQGAVVKDEEKDLDRLAGVSHQRDEEARRIDWRGLYAAAKRTLANDRAMQCVQSGARRARAIRNSPHIFGVRHLSPAAAWHLRQLLDRVRPKLVLIEGWTTPMI